MMVTDFAKDVFKEDRQKTWDEYTGNKPPTIRHNFVDYDRYYEASLIAGALIEKGVNLKNLNVLDFGCCAGDYGMYFARWGAFVHFEDIDEDALKFVDYRLRREGLKRRYNHEEHNLAIYGEVLEHCDDALAILTKDVEDGVRYIFTSSYPYRSDDPNDSYWQGRGHSQQARIDQPACRKILEDHYVMINFGGQRNLWIKKED